MENSSLLLQLDADNFDADLLLALNDSQAMRYLPVIIYMGLLMIIGTIGNSLVCYVFYCKPYRSTSRVFILTLSVLDLSCCVVGMVVEILDLRYPYTFNNEVACRILRFTTFATSISSGTVLVCVAFDRFFKVCRPVKKQLSSRFVVRMCLCAVLFGIFCSWPAVILFGIRKVRTENVNIVGTDCSTSDHMVGTIYPFIYYILLLFLFVFGLATLVVLYGFIGVRLCRLKRKRKATKGTLTPALSSVSVNSVSISTRTATVGKHTLTRRFSRAIRNTTKTTWMLFVITLAFVLSFLPYLIVMVLRHADSDYEFIKNPSHQLVLNFCLRSYFINSSINPLIYALMNHQFRTEIKNVLYGCKCNCRFNKNVLN